MISTVGRLGIVALLICVPLMFFNSTTAGQAFNFHPPLMLMTFAIYSASIQVYGLGQRSTSMVAKSSGRGKKQMSKRDFSLYHFAMIVTGEMFMIAGGLVIEYSKFTNSRPHFISWHGVMGVVLPCMVWTLIGSSFTPYFEPSKVIPILKRASLTFGQFWRLHRYAGIIVYTVLAAVILLGMESTWMSKQYTHWESIGGWSAQAYERALHALIAIVYVSTVWPALGA